jgi:ribose transport system ATP-binding protein
MAQVVGQEVTTQPTARTSEDNVLAVEGLECHFGATQALRGVTLSVRAGEVLALLGENGAGKSTLIKILAGVLRPSAGTIRFGGDVFTNGVTTEQARAHGLAFVHQDLGLLPGLSVAENIAHVAGFTRRRGIIRWQKQIELARELLVKWDLDIDPSTPVDRLEAAQRSLVAIARAIAVEAKVIVLDEPTAALPRHEVDLLYRAVERLCAGGVAVVYVTHRLAEVTRLADRAAVLRDGALVGTVAVGETSERAIVEMIVGAKLDRLTTAPGSGSDELLTLRDVAGEGADAVTLTLRRGEILALVGLVGAGHRSVGRIVAGAAPASHGEMQLAGAPYRPRTPRQAQRRGVVYVPGDRLRESSFPTLDTGNNYTLRNRLTTAFVSLRKERAEAAKIFGEWRVVPRSPTTLFAALSGGNQQKVVLAKWMTPRPDVFIAEEPTAGIDVATKSAIHDRLGDAARAGTAVLLLSSDADEVATIADRAIVFGHGTPRIELAREELTAARIAHECYVA